MTLPLPPELEALCRRVGHTFHDRSLLLRALAHRSWCAEQPGELSNERLEFLGDAVLGMIVADHVYRTYPDLPEGQLTDARKAVVNASALADIAQTLDLGPALFLGRGEDMAGGRTKTSILADALEALIAAVYLDGGMEAATGLVMRLLGDRVDQAVSGAAGLDFKSLLHELAGRQFESMPRYDITDVGPDHAKVFSARVYLDGQELGAGEGRSKKAAEQAAARAAWEVLTSTAEVTVGDA